MEISTLSLSHTSLCQLIQYNKSLHLRISTFKYLMMNLVLSWLGSRIVNSGLLGFMLEWCFKLDASCFGKRSCKHLLFHVSIWSVLVGLSDVIWSTLHIERHAWGLDGTQESWLRPYTKISHVMPYADWHYNSSQVILPHNDLVVDGGN